jgi:excisionase family DNA binding protein
MSKRPSAVEIRQTEHNSHGPLPSQSARPAETGLVSTITRWTRSDELPEFLTINEVATFLAIGRSSAYELIRTGRLPSVRFGRLIRIPKSALVAQLEPRQ